MLQNVACSVGVIEVVMQLTIGLKTACTSQDIPVDKEPGGSKLKHSPVMNKNVVIKLLLHS